MDGCIFCMIGRGDIPAHTLYEEDELIVIMDAAPASDGHCLILPKKHADDIFELDPETGGRIFQLAIKLAPAIKAALRCDGLNVVQNNGKIAGQTVGHFHMHLIPRYKGHGLGHDPDDDVQFFRSYDKAGEEELERIAKSIRDALAPL